jgi:hypothetical protein
VRGITLNYKNSLTINFDTITDTTTITTNTTTTPAEATAAAAAAAIALKFHPKTKKINKKR